MAFLNTPPRSVLQRRSVGPFGNEEPAFPESPSNLQQPLPSPPPSVTKKASIWDKEHAPETLARIGQAFLSNQNFGEGLGAAAGVMGDRMAGLRDETKKTISYGGPNGQFEIATDRNGNRSVREVPEFVQAVQSERDAKTKAAVDARAALTGKEMRDAQARLVYQINQLPQEQRPAAYADLMQNAKGYGIDTAGMPTQWNDVYGSVMGNSGLTVAQDRNGDRADGMADWRKQHGDRVASQGDARLELSRAAGARAAAKSSLPKAPPSTRKAVKLPNGFILN